MELFKKDIKTLDPMGYGRSCLITDSQVEAEKFLTDGSESYHGAVRGFGAGAESVEEFKNCVTGFYKEFGVGKFGLNKAFRVVQKDEKVQIEPITNVEHVYLDDLIGYESQKRKLIENTEAFIEGKAAE